VPAQARTRGEGEDGADLGEVESRRRFAYLFDHTDAEAKGFDSSTREIGEGQGARKRQVKRGDPEIEPRSGGEPNGEPKWVPTQADTGRRRAPCTDIDIRGFVSLES
jgi:hypothetical protein